MAAAALWFVSRYGDNVPAPDEWSMVPIATGHAPFTWQWLWSPWIGHRVPLCRLTLLALYKLSGLNFRAAQYLQVVVLAAVALLLIQTATHRRGHPSWTDSALPLILLSWVHWSNWLSGWQIQFTFSVCLTLLLLVCAEFRRWTLQGVCLLLLPVCGSNGALVAVVLIPWFLLQSRRLRSPALLACMLLTAGEVGFYLYGLPYERIPLYHPAVVCRLQDVAEMLGMQVGHGDPRDPKEFAPSLWFVIPLACCYAWALAVLARERYASLKSPTGKRLLVTCIGGVVFLAAIFIWAVIDGRLDFYQGNVWQLLGMLLLMLTVLSLDLDLRSAVMAGALLIAFVIAWKRPYPEFVTADRYVLLWTPLFVGIYLYGGGVQKALAAVAVVSLLCTMPFSEDHAARRHAELRRFVAAVNRGAAFESGDFCYRDAFGGRWTDQGVAIYYNPGGSLRSDLAMLRDAGHPNFVGYPRGGRERGEPGPLGAAAIRLAAARLTLIFAGNSMHSSSPSAALPSRSRLPSRPLPSQPIVP